MKRSTVVWIAVVFILMIASLALRFGNPDIPVKRLLPKYANADSKFVDLEGTSFHYRDEGSGYPIVLIHGFSSSLHTWDGWVQNLTNRYRVVRLDLPGFGLTGPWQYHSPTMDNYVKSVDLLVSKLGIRNFAICGNSMGGNVAWEYTVAHSNKISKLILEDANGYPGDAKLPVTLELAKYPVFNKIIRLMTSRKTVTENVVAAYADKSKLTPALAERYYELVMREGNRNALIDRLRITDPDHSAMIKTIGIPTLILWGLDDHKIPVGNAYRFKQDIPGSKLVVYTNVGHLAMEEAPQVSVKDVIQFLEQK